MGYPQFLAIIFIFLSFPIIGAVFFSIQRNIQTKLNSVIDDILIEFIFDEWIRRNYYVRKLTRISRKSFFSRFFRSILRNAILKYRMNLKGDSRNRVEWLYRNLDLNLNAKRVLKLGGINHKIISIRELSEMQVPGVAISV